MKKILLFLLLSAFTFGQDFAKDTVMVDGTQPVTILKIEKHKIYIGQNKELVTPYKLQKDGSFLSAGVPDVQISLLKKTIENPISYINYLFDTEKLKDFETKEIIKNDDIPIYIKMTGNNKERILILLALYPLKNQLLSFNMSIEYKDEDDKMKKFYELRDILEKGVLVLENYYSYRKE